MRSGPPNFCNAPNLCMYISQLSKRAETISNTCFGYLTKSYLTHELYFENQEKHAEKSRPLQDWMESISKRDRTDRVPVLECLLLAKNLALLVLQFHATPLLKESWNGKDIEFFGLGPKSGLRTYYDAEKLPRPFLEVEVSPPCTQATAASESSSLAEHAIRNNYLFRLGVIFLELAYQIPFSSLSSRSKGRNQSEFDKADQYSRSVDSIFGPRYAKIVRKCLGCDFGHDVDLRSQELRAAVYKQVVGELDILIHNFEKVDIAESDSGHT